jgi:hypothetical protein
MLLIYINIVIVKVEKKDIRVREQTRLKPLSAEESKRADEAKAS